MSIEFAILGFLTGGALSGYDLKKAFAETEGLHWSGNNNQVYKALVELHRGGLASLETQQPDEGPARKLYSITAKGRAALHAWLLTEPETPQFRLPILARLMSADLLSRGELEDLLARYAEELRLKILGLEELQRRGRGPSFGSKRQVSLWRTINRRPIALLRAEMEWVGDLRATLAKLGKRESR
jgi:PadR family transcriptional regulator AphA